MQYLALKYSSPLLKMSDVQKNFSKYQKYILTHVAFLSELVVEYIQKILKVIEKLLKIEQGYFLQSKTCNTYV